ncbi:uncharacterized protein LOC118510506 isoform X1 [Anopheles stephensi]|uniref:uncharacterized protein LOC118510506 isoform X1 n=2 Tax=Anopheles stephensi TaxID=30069 RepID=UPI001658B174|nr:uncharacterized protein LOC118510506 isoform X1 [Anopheles stephensi]
MAKQLKTFQLKKRQAAELIKTVEQFTSEYTDDRVSEVSVCLDQLERYYEDFLQASAKVSELDEDGAETYVAERCEMDTRYRRVKGFLLRRQPSNPGVSDSVLIANSTMNTTGRSSAVNVRLPKIELPTFDGDSTKWLTFRDRFVAMIDSSADIPNIMKLQYLLSSLKGDAGLLFEHTTLTADNYDVTWTALLKRYDNPRTLVREYYRKIHHLPTVSRERVDELAQLVDEFTRHVNGLKKLDEPVEYWDTPLANLLLMKLDTATILAWENHSAQHTKDKYKELVDFLHSRVRILKSTREFSHTELNTRTVAGSKKIFEHRPRLVGNTATAGRAIPHMSAPQPPQPPCIFGCTEAHHLRVCPEFANKDVPQRREIATRERLCWNCLNRHHQVRDCRSSYRCTTCKARHHSLLHVNSAVTMAAQSDEEMVLLETVLLQLVDDHGNTYDARALLDSGSMCNFVSETMAQRLLTPLSKVDVAISGIGQQMQHVKGSITAAVQSKGADFSTTMEFLVLKTPSADLPTTPINVESWFLPNIKLADPTFHVPGKVDVVIGGDTFWELHTGRKRSLGEGKPWLLETPFGWAISGNTSRCSGPNLRLCHLATNEGDIAASLQRFWEAESILEGPALSLEEDLCEKYYASTTTRNAQGRYVVSYPKAVDPVLHDFYVDDLLTGAASVSEAIETRKQISSMLESAGFSLKKWASNIPAALDGVPSADLAIKSVLDWQEDQAVSTLGLVWEPSNDMFRFRVDLPTPAEELTRCLVLSYTARIFDPLGLLGPTVILAKMFLQRLWGLKHEGKTLDWNRPLPAEIQEEWRRFHSTLYVLRELRVPRLVAHSNPERLQLHLFADASQGAYGACCYVRSDSTRGSTVRLLAAKSKVVSLSNTHSIARLELCAARLAVHLFQKVIRALNVSSSTVICWTDSMTVMHWLKSSPRRWKPFVANRVAQIQEETRISCWRHVPGSDNPADDISRGLRPEELLQCERWWQGPRWLSYGQEEWPVEPVLAKENETDIEERLAVSKIVITSTTCDFSNILFARYSSYGKLRRVVAYCLRILSNLRASKSTSINSVKRNTDMKTLLSSVPPLTAAELQDAELRLCQRAQHDSFAEEMDDLKRGKLVSGRSRLKWLSPYLDPKGVLRVGGRLGNANIPESTKHPIVLAASHRLSTLLVENTHHQKMHAGPQFMLATIRQKFWLIGGRNLAKSVYHRCHTCFRNKPTLVKQAVADLPKSRVTPTRPFAVSGVDYCGPFLLKSTVRNRSPTKAYIAIFVCFATRAVHIELVSDLTSTAFLSALRRFVARRGKVAELHSDNATTFKGAAHELHRIYRMLKIDEGDRRAIFDWCAENELVWKFIPPRAPHFGGLWEAAVKSAKRHLLKTIGVRSVTQENMLTLLAQVELCLNSRPLIPISDEPTDLEALTPGHFLIGSSMQAVPQVDLSKISPNRLKEYQLVQRQMQEIWARWYPEYLQQLQARAKHANNTPVKLEVNQLVIVKEDNTPPAVWPKGRITALHPGKDGVVRVVTLRVGTGKEIVRAVSRIALLPNPIEQRS